MDTLFFVKTTMSKKMKFFTAVFFLSNLLLIKAQTKDTLKELRRPDCTEYDKKIEQAYHKLIEDSKTIDYSGLKDLIVENINPNNFKYDNLKIYLKKVRTICGAEIDFSMCSPKKNLMDPLYNETIFWDEETIIGINEKLNRNLIFAVKYYGFGNSEAFVSNEEYGKRYTTNKLREYITHQKKGIYQERSFYYLPSGRNTKIDIENSDYLSLQFRNYAADIIVVKYEINYADFFKAFQYKNNEWEEIDNKEEFKF
ncbi:hypothetical protein [Chryseobacterium proteolyticum]|uniref:hypothetical protein n=1 Tax=Chryseobacterium proteolyticum TaxID=118127 RepID=UPI003982DCD2